MSQGTQIHNTADSLSVTSCGSLGSSWWANCFITAIDSSKWTTGEDLKRKWITYAIVSSPDCYSMGTRLHIWLLIEGSYYFIETNHIAATIWGQLLFEGWLLIEEIRYLQNGIYLHRERPKISRLRSWLNLSVDLNMLPAENNPHPMHICVTSTHSHYTVAHLLYLDSIM